MLKYQTHDPFTTDHSLDRLWRSIEERLLEFAALYNEVTTSDLQGMACVIAREIIAEVRLNQQE